VQEKHGQFTNFDPATGQPLLVGTGRLYNPDYNNWAPRVSAAWDVTGRGKTVVRAGGGVFYDAISQDLFLGHLPWNSVFDPGPAYAGFGPNPIFTASLFGGALDPNTPVYFTSGTMGDLFGADQHLRTPYLENYNLNLQQELTRHMVFQIGYVGAQGHKLYRFRDLNQPSQAAINAADLACDCINIYGSTNLSGPFNSAGIFYNYEESSANSNYNALQTSLRINQWHGLTSSINYSWSHSLDDASDGEDYVPNASQPNDSTAPLRFNRGNSNFDVRNRFTWNFIYTLPNPAAMKKLTNGWGLNGIVTVQSGQPFSVNYNFEDDYDGSGEGFGRPDLVGPVHYSSDPRNYLDLSSFAVPCSYPAGRRRRHGVHLHSRYASLRNRRPQLTHRTSLPAVRFFAFQEHCHHRAPQPGASLRGVQHLQPSQLRQPLAAGLHCRCRAEWGWHGRPFPRRSGPGRHR
jgi:hypothetical protein